MIGMMTKGALVVAASVVLSSAAVSGGPRPGCEAALREELRHVPRTER